jgi:hypothetical protein
MSLIRIYIVICIVLGCILVCGGCLSTNSTPPQTNSYQNISLVNVSTLPVTTAIIQKVCNQSFNTTPWIQISPIGAIRKGDKIRINGTTNILPGKTLELEMYSSSKHSQTKCGFGDYLSTIVKIQKGDECNNTFSLYFDSTNFQPDEDLIIATYPENTSVTNGVIFDIQENSTPIIFPNESKITNYSTNSSFALLPLNDVSRGDIQTVLGIRKGTPYAITYSIRDAKYGADCLPYCQGEIIRGTINPITFGQDSSQFAIRFDTSDFEPGQYVVDLDFTCSDATAKGWFNVTPNIPVVL